MLYKIDYITRNKSRVGEKYVNFAADRTEGVSRFMEWFFANHPEDAVRIDHVMEIEIVGDLTGLDLIDSVAAERKAE